MRVAVVVVVALGSMVGVEALAGPVCAVHQDPYKELEECIAEVDEGGQIVLPSGETLETSGVVIGRSMTFHTVNPDLPATIRHVPVPEDIIEGDPFAAGYPVPHGAMITVEDGADVSFTAVRFAPFDGNPEAPGVTLSRAFLVTGGHLVLDRIGLDPIVSATSRGISSQPGAYLAEGRGTSAELTVTNSTFTDVGSTRHFGGAIYVVGGIVNIVGETTFTGCAAYKGGAISAWYGATVNVVPDNRGNAPQFLENNAAWLGGAISLEKGTPSLYVEGATFEGNRVTAGKGGAIYAENTDLHLLAARFASNAADEGGAVFQLQGSGLVEACSFEANQATAADGAHGGAIANQHLDSFSVQQTRFEGNLGSAGGAIHIEGGNEVHQIERNLFCANTATFGDALIVDGQGSEQQIRIANNLLDGQNAGSSYGIWITGREYDVSQNTVVRQPGGALRVDGGAGGTGSFLRRNVVGWLGEGGAVVLETASDQPGTIAENSWYDASGAWAAPILVGETAGPTGAGDTIGPLRYTGTRGDGLLASGCEGWPHHLRPDSPLINGSTWDTPTVIEQTRGAFGGTGYLRVDGIADPWTTDADGDGVVAMWDCDDSDDQLGVELVQYEDLDGDGAAGTHVGGWLCQLGQGNSLVEEDCDDLDGSVTENCGDTGDTDDWIDPEPEPEDIYWYGGCSTVGGGPLLPLSLLPLLLVARRRKRPVG